MIPLVNTSALEELLSEVNSEGIKKFVMSTMQRVTNENPNFAGMLNFFAKRIKTERGEQGAQDALMIGTMCYRAIELAGKSAEVKMISAPEEDPLQTASPQALQEAQETAFFDIQKIMRS